MIKIDPSRDELLTPEGLALLRESYMLEHETSPQEAFARAAGAFASNPEHGQRLYDYASRHWMMFATPILSNAGRGGGLPISCELNYVGDSRREIMAHVNENTFLASEGGGIGGYWGHLRGMGTRTSKGVKSGGLVPWLKLIDSQIEAVNQTGVRKASYCAYLDIHHPEIEEFISIRKPTGGDLNRKCLNLHHGVNLTDDFMYRVDALTTGIWRGVALTQDLYDTLNQWELVDPHTKLVTKTVLVTDLWEAIIATRMVTGEPFLHYVDRSNEHLPQWLKDLGLVVRHSNLCTEITLPVNEDRTAVCCLSSPNAEYYDEWKDHPLFLRDIAEMLDNVLMYFADNAPEELWRAVNSARNEHSIGVGCMGFHSYLQKRGIPYESAVAISINKKIFRTIRKGLDKANRELAIERGEAPDAKGYGVRFSHVMAVAPNASSGKICGGASPSTEMYPANAYLSKGDAGSYIAKNRYLKAKLAEYGRDTDETWKSIIANQGSVQHLDFLTEYERDTFKTVYEVDQQWHVQHAGDRQPEIDQAQSLNLYLPANAHWRTVHDLLIQTWKRGLKSVYYQRSISQKVADQIAAQSVRRSLAVGDAQPKYEECLGCQG
jgi:ribonucleoside-diphosphate reductase alpha chain